MEIFQFKDTQDVLKDGDKAKASFELADVILYCFSMADVLDLDLSEAVGKKIVLNSEKYPVDKVKGNYVKYTELK